MSFPLSSKRTTKVILTSVLLFGFFGQVSALNFTIYFNDSTGSATGWETCSGNIDTTQTSYTVGENLSVNGTLRSTNIDFNSSCSITDLTTNGSFVSSQVPLGNKTAPPINFSGSYSLAGLSINTAGTHSLGFLIEAGCSSGCAEPPSQINLPVTVVAAASPTVNINFSLMDTLKSLVSDITYNTVSFFTEIASAQTNPQAKLTVIADVSIVDVKVTSTSSPFSGVFSLQGKLGQQNDIIYGAIVTDDKGVVLDAKVLGNVAHINQGETQKHTFSYTLPSAVSGDIHIFLTADTKEGLTLSTNKIFSGKITGTTSIFPCTYTRETKLAKSKLECLSEKNTTLTAEYTKGSIFNTPIQKETLTLVANKKLLVTPNLAPGEYFVTLTDTTTNEKRIFRITKDGVYGTISSVVVHTDGAPGEVKVVVFSEVSTSSIVSVSLSGPNGESCGNGDTEVKGMAAEFTFTITCTSGNIVAVLKDKQGVILSTSTQPFSVIVVKPVTTVNTEGDTSKNTLAVIALGALTLAGLSVLYLRNKNRKDVVTTF